MWSTYLQAVPKAELHVHLEGSIQPATLLSLAQRNQVSLPFNTIADLRRWFVFRDFAHFIQVYDAIVRCLRTAADYELITYELGAELARQNVRYAEVTCTAGVHVMHHCADTFFSGLTAGRERVRSDFGLELNWIFDISREISSWPDFKKYADFTTSVAIEGLRDGVVALGLGGPEVGNPPALFKPWFERARAAGLHSAPHAGETAGPASIWGAVQELGAERIGHGVRAVEDPALLQYLAEQQIALEVCPTSNLRLGVYPDFSRHSLRHLYAAGVAVTINSDDPALFNTTLNDEVALLAAPFGFDMTAINQILLNGVRYSFLPPARKQTLEAEFKSRV